MLPKKKKDKKRGNGAAQDANQPISLTPAQQVQQRIEVYEQALQERMAKVEETKETTDRLTAEILQIRGAIGEAREVLTILEPEGQEVVMPPEPTTEPTTEAQV